MKVVSATVRALLVAALLIVSVAAGIWVHHRKAIHRRSACIGRLHGLGMVLRRHAAENSGRFTRRWSTVGDRLNEPRMFICPSGNTVTGDLQNVDAWTDYVLVPGRQQSDAPQTTVLAFCRCSEDGGSILFVDGHVEWMEGVEYRKRVDAK